MCSHKTGFLPSANELHICLVVMLQFYELLCSESCCFYVSVNSVQFCNIVFVWSTISLIANNTNISQTPSGTGVAACR